MILVVGTVRVPEEAFASARDAMHTMLTKTRNEDGCIRYQFAQDVMDPQLLVISEAWRDRDALMAHGKAPHMAEWRQAMGAVGVIERDLRMYETGEGTPI